MPSQKINTISLRTFNNVLSRYASVVPDNLRDLDASRYGVIPDAYAERSQSKHLTHAEVETLVEWKLKHGTFRPKLLQLVQSNDAEVVKQTTKSAFGCLPNAKDALKILTNLKGIGPATASLLLSVAAPDTVPFFSDELFRWCIWEESGTPKGWQRKIKYSAKEYEMLLEKVRALLERLDVKAVDAEKVAWVLGKDGVDIDEDIDEDIASGDERAIVQEREVTSNLKEKLDNYDKKLQKKRKAIKDMQDEYELEKGKTAKCREEYENSTDEMEAEAGRTQEEFAQILESTEQMVEIERKGQGKTTAQETAKGTKRKAKPLSEASRKSTRSKK